MRVKTDDPELGQLFAMWVAPEARRRGVGRAIVDFALRTLEARGATSVELTVTEGTTPRCRCTSRSGSSTVASVLREGSPLRVVWMRAEL